MAERVAGIGARDAEEEQALVSAISYDDPRVAGLAIPLERDRVTVVVAYVELHEHDWLLPRFNIKSVGSENVAHVVVVNHPKVKTYARMPESRNVISNVRGALGPHWRTSWYIRGSVTVPAPDSSTSRPWASPGGRPSRRTAKRTGARESGGSRTRLTSRAWKRYVIEPAGASSAAASSRTDHSPLSAHWLSASAEARRPRSPRPEPR